MGWLEILGIMGGLCFGFAAVPAAYRTLRARKHLGTPLSICMAIFFGCLLMWTYLFLSFGFDWVVTGTYGVETVSWAVLLYYAWKARLTGEHPDTRK